MLLISEESCTCMTMKLESSDSSYSSLSSSCTSDGNAMDVNHPNYKKSLIHATSRNAKSKKAQKCSSELEPNSSTDDDGSASSVCNTSSSFQKEKQLPHTLVRGEAASEQLLSSAGKDSAALKPEWPPESFDQKKAWSNYKQAQQQVKQLEEGGPTNPCNMDKGMPSLLRQDQPLTLVKSNSVSATKADNILKLDYITASSSNSYHAHNTHKLQGHRLSTGDSPLHMQKRYSSTQGPSASLRTGFPSPGTPSRSSFSGVPTSLMQLHNKSYYNMVGRIAVNEGNGKLLPLYSLPPCCDQDANAINPGRLSVGRAAPPPSKWDDAEKWLVNASPSHPSQPAPLHPPPSKQATNHITNQGLNSNPHPEGKKNVSGVNKRVLNDVMVSSSPPHSQVGDHHHYHHKLGYNLYTSKDNSSFAGMSMHDSYIHSRSLVPLASSSSDGQMQEDGGGSALSDSELSNTQDECKSAFVRSTSHRQSTDGQHKYYSKKGHPGRKSSLVSKEELVISSPVSMQLERLKLGSSTSASLHQPEQLPKMHDIYAVETTANELRIAGPCSDERPGGERDVAGAAEGGASSSMTRLVVQAGKVVGRWGAGAMRDAATDVSPKMSMSRRDMGTQMTPVASSKTSRAATPRKSGSPVRHNTPTFGGTLDHSAHANATTAEGRVSCQGGSDFSVSTTSHEGSSSSSWKSLQDSLLMSSSEPHMTNNNNSNKEMQQSAALKSQDMESLQQKSHDNLAPSAQYSAWEEAERSKHMTKCAREEARIDAWESHQKAKAEAELKKLEMKLERLRAQATEKIMNKVATAHLRAEEMRATARAQQAEQLAKALERANSLSRKGGGYFPESLGVCFSLMP